MFTGNYNFFDYKYNIEGYNGQDFGGFPQYLYLIISIIILSILLFSLRKSSKDKVLKIIRFIGIFMIFFYISKTIWESYYDIKLTGEFNTYLLPFDSCSIIMIASLLAGFAKGKLKDYSECWLTTGSIVGGIGTMVHLNAFKYYPFLSFGAFYSMIWLFLMLFIGLLLIITKYKDIKYSLVLKGFLFHFVISLIVIPIDFIFNFDFMMYKELGGIPFFEDIASKLISMNLNFLNPILMLLLYLLSFHIIYIFFLLLKQLKIVK